MAYWKKEAVKIIASEPEKHLDYHATILKHAHERGWLEALQWAASQIVPDGNPEVALETINREICGMLPLPSPTGLDSDCQMTAEPSSQCCCNCIYLRPVHYHCCTEPKPADEQKKSAGIEGRCVCGVQKGWACVGPDTDRIYDNWPRHSCGCECYMAKTPNIEGGKMNATYIIEVGEIAAHPRDPESHDYLAVQAVGKGSQRWERVPPHVCSMLESGLKALQAAPGDPGMVSATLRVTASPTDWLNESDLQSSRQPGPPAGQTRDCLPVGRLAAGLRI